MAEVAITPEDMTEDDILAFTQRTRKQLVDHMTSEGMPNKPREQEVLLTALSDMDRTVHTNKKIGVSEKQLGAGLLVAKALEDITNHFGNRNPFENGNVIDGESTEQLPQQFNDGSLPEVEPVPGEMDIGISTEKFETFVDKFED